MPVSEAMRQVEWEIDERLKQLPLWRFARDKVLRATLDLYRDAHEHVEIACVLAFTSGRQEDFLVLNQQLQRFQAGFFQVLKWALTLCSEQSAETFFHQMIYEAQDLGAKYETLVDSLKAAKHGVVEIVVDEGTRQVTVYEGGDITGTDWGLVDRQRNANLFHSHVSLAEDGDQLTKAWTAGVYRRTVSWLGALAMSALSKATIFCMPNGVLVPLPYRSVVVRVPEPPDQQFQAVLDDLTLGSEKLTEPEIWRYVSWLDTPLVVIGTERQGPSDLLIALATIGGEDHMLRLAATADKAQYEKVSGLRESRMIKRCSELLEQQGWKVDPHYKLHNPDKEIDVYAIREGVHLVLQLKSTLRPEAAGEVYNRNEDINAGIAQARDTRTRIGAEAIGAVITDGYRGDYSTWSKAIEHQIPIGTLEDISDIARNPRQIFELLKTRVGFTGVPPEGAPFERACELMGWNFRIVDSRPSSSEGVVSMKHDAHAT